MPEANHVCPCCNADVPGQHVEDCFYASPHPPVAADGDDGD